MKHTFGTDELRDRAALYALGALSQQEARAFDDHLDEGCEVCRTEVRGFDSVVESLGLGAAEIAPPSAARDKLLAWMAQESG